MLRGPTTRSERGQALVLLVLALLGLIGFAAVALDGGNLYTEQRRAQAAADNAVLAAAFAQMNNVSTTVNLRNTALDNAALNGYDNNTTTNWVSFYRPPLHGPYAGSLQHMEVMITQSVSTALAHFVYGQNPIPVTVFAVAHGQPAEPFMAGYAIASFHPLCDSNIFTPRGGVGSIIKDGGVFVNADPTCEETINLSGGNARLATTSSAACPNDAIPPDQPGGCYINGGFPIDIGGLQDVGVTCNDPPPAIDWWSPPGQGTDCNFYPAPLHSPRITSYPAPVTTSQFSSRCSPNQDALLNGPSPLTLSPGSYTHMNVNKDVELQSGIYCITGVGASNRVLNTRSLKGYGVFIYIQDEAAEFKYEGGALDISAPFAGEYGLTCPSGTTNELCAVQGIVLYKPNGRAAENGCGNNSAAEISFSGNADMVIRGLIWAPESYMTYTGNGNLYMIGQALVGCVKYAGNGELDVTYSPDDSYNPAPSVRLDE